MRQDLNDALRHLEADHRAEGVDVDELPWQHWIDDTPGRFFTNLPFRSDLQ